MELKEILNRFPDCKKVASNRYEGSCPCPAHKDTHSSFALYVNGEWVNPQCFAGCSEEDILNAVCLDKADLHIGTTPYKPKVVNKTRYDYKKEDGTLSYFKVRYDYEDRTKSFCFCLPDGTKGLKGLPHLLYNLPGIKEASTVIFVEGEKCADALIKQGIAATTLDSGANSRWDRKYNSHLKGKSVFVLPDNDDAGIKYAKRIQYYLPWAVVKKLPYTKPKEDIADLLAAGFKVEDIEGLPNLEEEKTSKASNEDVSYAGDKRQSSEVLIEIIKNQDVKLFLNENNEPFAEIAIDGHKELYALDSNEFRLWTQKAYHDNTRKAIRKDGVTQVTEILAAETRFGASSEICRLSNRVGLLGTDFWYDLTNRKWSAVKITSSGWSIVSDVPRVFTRYRHQLEQVKPISGGDIRSIFKYVNMSEEFQLLFLCWLVSCFVPDIPHPMPIFTGEKGAAKSTACVLTKRIIDPSVLETLTLSKDERSLVVNLQQHYYLPFDNVSAISNDVSDTLCRAITGGAVQQRKLHTNGEDYIFTFKRCLAINGISNVANRSDLLDRSIIFELERVPEDKRRELNEVYAEFEADRPYILGAVFDTLSKAMKIYPTVKLSRMTRMADFCRWGYAIAEVIGGDGDKFLDEYKANQALENTEAINSDTVAYLVVELMRNCGTWRGRMSELLTKLQEEAEKHGINPKSKNLPQAPNNLSRRIKSVRSNLEAVGIVFDISNRYSDGTYINIKNQNFAPLPPYTVKIGDILGKSNGDKNGDNTGDGDKKLPYEPTVPSAKTVEQAENGDDGGNGDNYEDIEF